MSRAGSPSQSTGRCVGRQWCPRSGPPAAAYACLPALSLRCSREKGRGRRGAPRAALAQADCSRLPPVRSTGFWVHPACPHRDGIFGARVNDGLQQVVKLVHVQLGLLQELLHLLLHCMGQGRRHLLLGGQVGPKLPVSALPLAPGGLSLTRSPRTASGAVMAMAGRAGREQSELRHRKRQCPHL